MSDCSCDTIEIDIDKYGKISGSRGIYKLLRVISRRSYVKVFEAIDLITQTPVVIKIQDFELGGQYEKSMIDQFRGLNPDKYNLVQCYDSFRLGEKMGLVFELLDTSLQDFMEMMTVCTNKQFAFSLVEIRFIIKQLLVSLQALERIGIIHSDIKADNVMLKSEKEKPYRVKLIDFGCAHTRAEEKEYFSLCYGQNVPEVILGLPCTEAMDMWSLGLLMAKLFLGTPLYPAKHSYDFLRLVTGTQGLPPADLLDCGYETKTFFTRDWGVWRLKTEEEFTFGCGGRGYWSVRAKCRFKTLRQLKDCYRANSVFERQDLEEFLDLLEKMLNLDPRERITPTEALQHKYINKLHSSNADIYNENRLQRVCHSTAGEHIPYHSKHVEASARVGFQRSPIPHYSSLLSKDKDTHNSDRTSVSNSFSDSPKWRDNGSTEDTDASNRTLSSDLSRVSDTSSDRLSTRHAGRGLVTDPTRDRVYRAFAHDPSSDSIQDSRDRKIGPLKRIINLFFRVFQIRREPLKKLTNFFSSVVRTIYQVLVSRKTFRNLTFFL